MSRERRKGSGPALAWPLGRGWLGPARALPSNTNLVPWCWLPAGVGVTILPKSLLRAKLLGLAIGGGLDLGSNRGHYLLKLQQHGQLAMGRTLSGEERGQDKSRRPARAGGLHACYGGGPAANNRDAMG